VGPLLPESTKDDLCVEIVGWRIVPKKERLKSLGIKPGLILKVNPKRVIDGDTVAVEVTLKFHVRLRGVYAPELHNDDGSGEISKNRLEDLLNRAEAEEKSVYLYVPSNSPNDLMDSHSFNRVVGDLFIEDINVADLVDLENEFD